MGFNCNFRYFLMMKFEDFREVGQKKVIKNFPEDSNVEQS